VTVIVVVVAFALYRAVLLVLDAIRPAGRMAARHSASAVAERIDCVRFIGAPFSLR
jgi:hypothetical protein